MTDQIDFSVRQARLDAMIFEFRRSVDQMGNVRAIEACYDAISTLHDVASGLSCQPRFYNSERNESTKAGVVFDGLVDYLGCQVDALAAAMREAKPEDWDEVEIRENMLIANDVSMGSNATQTIAFATQLAEEREQ